MKGRFSMVYSDLISKGSQSSENAYLVLPIGKQLSNWFVGVDDQDNPCILVKSVSNNNRQPPSIRLENLSIQFHVPCKIERPSESVNQSTCSVMRLNSPDEAIREVFFSVCDSIVTLLGNSPEDNDLSKAMRRLASIFRRMLEPPARTLSGLFGELVLIHCSLLPYELVRDWREADEDRYDFSSNDLKVEVKSTASRKRIHEFSFEQCSPPTGVLGLVTSIFVERASRGTSIREIQELIEVRLSGRPDSILKLRAIVAETLGTAQRQADGVSFDLTLAMQSIAFFDLNEVPAIRGKAPANVSSIRFSSDLSESTELDVNTLADSYPFLTAYMKNG